MEPHVRLPTASIHRVLFSVCFLLSFLPFVHAGTCIIPGAGICQNDTYNTNTGTITQPITQAICESASVGGTWDTVDDVNSVAACQVGCCCGGSGAKTIAAACSVSTTFVAASDSETCTDVCLNAPPPTAPSCGEGIVSAEDLAAHCTCGQNPATAVDEYCCWNGELAADASSCDPIQTICTPNTVNSNWCMCGNQPIYNQICCKGDVVVAADAQCPQGTPQIAACGNQIKETGEECDARYVWAPNTNPPRYVLENPSETANSCSVPGTFCTTQCTCLNPQQQSNCDNGICDSTENSQTCPSDCPTAPHCTIGSNGAPKPINLAGQYDENTLTTSLNWQPDNAQCTAGLLGFIVQRSTVSRAAAQQTPDFVSEYLSTQTTTYPDTIPASLPATATTLYYAVGAIYRADTGATIVGYDFISIGIPNSICPQADSSYCADDLHTVNCANYQNDTVQCDAGYTCQIQAGKALCVEQAPCETCNGIYQSFARDAELLVEVDPVDGPEIRACSRANTCFKDLRQTSIEYYIACAEISSCVGYRSQEACERNMCTRPGGPDPGNSCEWVQTSTDVSNGVCRPRDQSFQDCTLCSELGSACTQTTCEAISSQTPTACYYHTPDPNNQYYSPGTSAASVCMNKDEVPCEFLHSQQQCEGGTEYELNIVYSGTGSQLASSGGDHATLSQSSDVLEKGQCKWFPDLTRSAGGYCAKDSDDSEKADIDERPSPYIPKKDIVLDFTAPATSIAAVPLGYFPSSFTVPVINESPVLYAICPLGQANCYPTKTTTTGFYQNTIRKTFQYDESGSYALRYYAEDNAQNLEKVKEFEFIIDAQPPVVSVGTPVLNSYAFNSTTLLTATYIPFTTSELATCKTELLSGNPLAHADYFTVRGVPELGEGSGPAQYATSFSMTYPMLPDGQYFLNISCTDQNGNTNPTNVAPIPYAVIVDSDPRIQNASPVTTIPVKDTSVTLHIETNSSASCRYAPKTSVFPDFDDMTPYTTTGGTVHEITIPVVTGNYEFISACDMSGQEVYSNDADTIRFKIDQIAPQTQVCSKQATTNANCVQITMGTANKQERYDLTLRCIDSGSVSAGCDYQYDIYSCTNEYNQPDCTPKKGNYDIQIVDNTAVLELWYYTIDKAGNKEVTKNQTLYAFDLQPPLDPIFRILP